MKLHVHFLLVVISSMILYTKHCDVKFQKLIVTNCESMLLDTQCVTKPENIPLEKQTVLHLFIISLLHKPGWTVVQCPSLLVVMLDQPGTHE